MYMVPFGQPTTVRVPTRKNPLFDRGTTAPDVARQERAAAILGFLLFAFLYFFRCSQNT